MSNEASISSVATIEPGDGKRVTAKISLSRRVRRWLAHRAVRLLMSLYFAVYFVAKIIGRRYRQHPDGRGCEILLTGTFYSENWIMSFLRPLAASQRCSRLLVVSTYPISPLPKVLIVYPPRWLLRLVGAVPARLITFTWIAIRKRPDIVGGFHLLVNAMLASVLAPLVGARSLYFCVGGPMEILDGGIWAENRIFGKMENPDLVVERRLIEAASACDQIVTMGSRAKTFFRDKGVETDIHVVPGGIDAEHFSPVDNSRPIDLIMLGRLSEIKRVDVFLHTLKYVISDVPTAAAVVVGDGKLREGLVQLAKDLGVNRYIRFVGYVDDVKEYLGSSKIFVLTSDSEGLSLAMMEAMMCGLPAVVSNVGELGELVEDGVNGYLIERRSPKMFADRIVRLLKDDDLLARFSLAARQSALRYEVAAVSRRWDSILTPTGPS